MGEGLGGVGMHQGSADAMEELLGPFPVVRLRGLPFEAQVRDVILFFQVRGCGGGGPAGRVGVCGSRDDAVGYGRGRVGGCF
jgi:hypothetical protein